MVLLRIFYRNDSLHKLAKFRLEPGLVEQCLDLLQMLVSGKMSPHWTSYFLGPVYKAEDGQRPEAQKRREITYMFTSPRSHGPWVSVSMSIKFPGKNWEPADLKLLIVSAFSYK